MQHGSVRSLLGAAVVGLLLTGCVPDGPAVPTATPAPEPVQTPTPTPEAVDPLAEVTQLVVRPEHLELRDAQGTTVAELSYDQPTTEIVDALNVVFAAEPTQESLPMGYEVPQRDVYTWDGFTVVDDLMGHLEDPGAPRDAWVWIADDRPDEIEMNVHVSITTGAVNGVSITTVQGFGVGEFDSLVAEVGIHDEWAGELSSAGTSYRGVKVESGPVLGPEVIEGEPNAYSVSVSEYVDGETTTVTILAPFNFGVGHV